MVSESVSWPVSMMIGALKPFLRRMRTASRPSMSGRPTSMITRSIWPPWRACTPLVPVSTAIGLELLVQRELLDQRLAQFGIVVDDQDLAGIRHGIASGAAPQLREVEHSGEKAQAPALLIQFAKGIVIGA